jgi:hypothetical protein
MFLNVKEYQKDREVVINTDNISYFHENKDGDNVYTHINYIKGSFIHVEEKYDDLKFILTGADDMFSYNLAVFETEAKHNENN